MIDHDDMPGCLLAAHLHETHDLRMRPVRHRDMRQIEGAALAYPVLPDILRGVVIHRHLFVLLLQGELNSGAELADRYGITKGTVDAIRQGRLWEAVTRDVRRPKRDAPVKNQDAAS